MLLQYEQNDGVLCAYTWKQLYLSIQRGNFIYRYFKLFPTKLLMSHVSIINIILRIVNLCISSGVFPTSCFKSAIIIPFIKKQGLKS